MTYGPETRAAASGNLLDMQGLRLPAKLTVSECALYQDSRVAGVHSKVGAALDLGQELVNFFCKQ